MFLEYSTTTIHIEYLWSVFVDSINFRRALSSNVMLREFDDSLQVGIVLVIHQSTNSSVR
jgi:hypothetical protein